MRRRIGDVTISFAELPSFRFPSVGPLPHKCFHDDNVTMDLRCKLLMFWNYVMHMTLNLLWRTIKEAWLVRHEGKLSFRCGRGLCNEGNGSGSSDLCWEIGNYFDLNGAHAPLDQPTFIRSFRVRTIKVILWFNLYLQVQWFALFRIPIKQI